MSQRTRAKQLEIYDGTQSRKPPIWAASLKDKKRKAFDDEASGSELVEKKFKVSGPPDEAMTEGGPPVMRRPTSLGISGQVLTSAFNQSTREYLTKKIKPVLRTPEKLDELKAKLLAGTKLPALFPRADQIAQCARGEVRKFFDSPEGPPVLNINKYLNYIQENFDSIKDDLGGDLESPMRDMDILSTASTQASDVVMSSQHSYTDTDEISSQLSETSQSTLQTQDDSYHYGERRTITVPFDSIIHKDLDKDMKDEVYKKFDENMHKATDYIADFGLLVYSLMLVLKTSIFSIDAATNDLKIKSSQGFPISRIFPSTFQSTSDIHLTAPPLSPDICISEKNQKVFDTLFGNQHLEFIYSTFFGSRGPKKATIDKHPVLNLLNTPVNSIFSNFLQKKDLPGVHVMKLSLDQYKVNMANMWSSRRQINKLFDKFLQVLLKIHLAPNRERNYVEMLQRKKEELLKKKSDDSNKMNGYENLTRNQRRNLLRTALYKRKKYQRKCENKPGKRDVWINKMEDLDKTIKAISDINKELRTKHIASQKQKGHEEMKKDDAVLDKPESLTSTDELSQDDMEIDNTTDVSQRRLGELKGIIKTTLFKFHGQILKEHHFRDSSHDITDKEMKVCLLLANTFMPYLPSKQNYSTIGHQLPLVFFANDILRYAGYSRFCRSICPLTKPSHLHALRLDCASIYSIFSLSKDSPITLFDLDGYVIGSESETYLRKDATFYQLFDLPKMMKICESRNLKFAHYLMLLPGLKMVQITGEIPGTSQQSRRKAKPNQFIDDTPWETIAELQKKTDDALLKGAAEKKKEIDKTLKDSKQFNLAMKEKDFSSTIKALKAGWNPAEGREEANSVTYQKIEDLKKEKSILQAQLLSSKQNISRLRHERYLLIKAKNSRTSSKHSTKTTTPLHNIEGTIRSHVLKKAEEMQIDKSKGSLNNLSFSGTDNGLVTMTETIPMTLDCYKYHLKLNNRYDLLQELGDDKTEQGAPVEFDPLPKTFKVKSEHIDYVGGYLRQRKNLERLKKYSKKGKEVVAAENEMAKSSIDSVSSPEQVVKVHTVKKRYSDLLRSFYYSKRMVTIKKSIYLWNSKCRDRLCSKERKFVQESGKHLVMLIGDRGFGYGSRITGFNRYGGKWKRKIHSNCTTVAITNEYKTSQTCVYCFGPIIHPKQRVKKKDKIVLKECNGAMQCINPDCISVKQGKAIQSRDKVSAMAIAISGLTKLLFSSTLPAFSNH